MVATRQMGLLSFVIVFVVIGGAFLSLPGLGHSTSSTASNQNSSSNFGNTRHRHSSTTTFSSSSTVSESSSSSSSTTSTSSQTQFRNSLIWLFENYTTTLQSIYNNPGSFTIVSPTLFSINSTTGQFQGNATLDEPIESSIIDHGLQVWPIISSSSDTSIANMTSCSEYQQEFIRAAINAASFSFDGRTYSINGFNVDFEPSQSISPGSTYTVQPGDYLSLIGQKCGVSWQSIASANGLVSPYVITPGEILKIPNFTPIYDLFDQFMSNFASALHQRGMILSVDVAPWNMIQSEAPNNGGNFWDYAGLASSVDYVVDMDYVSYFCVTSSGSTSLTYSPSCVPYAQMAPKNYDGWTFYDQYLLTQAYVPQSKIMIGLESIACGGDGGSGSNCLAGQEINFLVKNGISAIAVWPSPIFLSTNGLSTSPYPANYDWYFLSEAFIEDQS
jgi:LysM repeat protein